MRRRGKAGSVALGGAAFVPCACQCVLLRREPSPRRTRRGPENHGRAGIRQPPAPGLDGASPSALTENSGAPRCANWGAALKPIYRFAF